MGGVRGHSWLEETENKKHGTHRQYTNGGESHPGKD